MATMTCKSKTPSTFGKKNKTASRSYIAVQNFMEGDEFVMRGEPNIFVEKIVRNEKAGSVKVVFCSSSSEHPLVTRNCLCFPHRKRENNGISYSDFQRL